MLEKKGERCERVENKHLSATPASLQQDKSQKITNHRLHVYHQLSRSIFLQNQHLQPCWKILDISQLPSGDATKMQQMFWLVQRNIQYTGEACTRPTDTTEDKTEAKTGKGIGYICCRVGCEGICLIFKGQTPCGTGINSNLPTVTAAPETTVSCVQ